MLDKSIKKPMIAGIILYAIAFLIVVIIYLTQYHGTGIFILKEYDSPVKVVPMQLYTFLFHLLLLGVFYLIMYSYVGNSHRTVEVVLLVIYVLVSIISGFVVSYLNNYFIVRKGQEYIVASSGMSNSINLFTSLFVSISNILVIVAIGRYGVSDRFALPAGSSF